MQMQTILSGPDGSMLRKGNFPNLELLEQCVIDITPALHIRPPIIVWNKPCRQKRDVGFFCNDPNIKGYTYSNQMMLSQPLSSALDELIVSVNSIFDSDFNAILVNRYNTGDDVVLEHSDNETFLDSTQGVVSLSYGATRKFRVRDKTTQLFIDTPATHGSLLQMAGPFQRYYKHGIPAEKRVREPRISFTFRRHYPDPDPDCM
jgi:alkylated DNA repair dioxygenase AlkB